jgi:hypothetical protein
MFLLCPILLLSLINMYLILTFLSLYIYSFVSCACCSSLVILNTLFCVCVCVLYHAPAALLHTKGLVTNCTGGWLGVGAGRECSINARPHRVSTPGRPSHSQSLYQLRYFFYGNSVQITKETVFIF